MLAGAVTRHSLGKRARGIAHFLKQCRLVIVAIPDLTDGGMVEPHRMADFVGEGVAQIVDFEITVKADLPAPRWIETNQRLR